jgi:hypothetical protein
MLTIPINAMFAGSHLIPGLSGSVLQICGSFQTNLASNIKLASNDPYVFVNTDEGMSGSLPWAGMFNSLASSNDPYVFVNTDEGMSGSLPWAGFVSLQSSNYDEFGNDLSSFPTIGNSFNDETVIETYQFGESKDLTRFKKTYKGGRNIPVPRRVR